MTTMSPLVKCCVSTSTMALYAFSWSRLPIADGLETRQKRARPLFLPSALRSHNESATHRSVSSDRCRTRRYRQLSIGSSGLESRRKEDDSNVCQISRAPYELHLRKL